MNIKLREKANSFDRILRQRAANYLKNAEKHTLRLLENAYDKKLLTILKRIENLKNGVSQIRTDIEYGSFLSLPTFRSGRRFQTESPTRAEEEIPKLLFVGELILLECRSLFEKLQSVEREAYLGDESRFTELFAEAEESLRRIEELQLIRSSTEMNLVDSFIASYEEKVGELEDLAERENLLVLEKSYLLDCISMNKSSIFARFMSAITRKPVFEKEISEIIISLGEKLRTKTGGLVKLPVLYSMIRVTRPSLSINIQDVENVVRNLEKKGVIPGIREVSGIKIVELVPVTATPDQDTILEMAINNGQLTLEEVLIKTKWTYERATRALRQMEELGICKYDEVSRKWIFPTFTEDHKLEEI